MPQLQGEKRIYESSSRQKTKSDRFDEGRIDRDRIDQDHVDLRIMFRHSLIVLILLGCVCSAGTGESVRLHPKKTANPTTEITTAYPWQPHDLRWGSDDTEREMPLRQVSVIKRKTSAVPPGGPWLRDRRSYELCQVSLATKIDKCTQTFERLFAEHMRTTAKTSITLLEVQRLCRQHDESLYCLHVELRACPPRTDHLDRIAEEIGHFRDYMEHLCRIVRQTQHQTSSTVPIYSSLPLESYMLHKKFNPLKHTGFSVMQKTVTKRFQSTYNTTANSFGYASRSNLSSKMPSNGNVNNDDSNSDFNKGINHNMSTSKVSEQNATEAYSTHRLQNSVGTAVTSNSSSSAATMPILEPQILYKRNNPKTRNSSISKAPDFRCIFLQLICCFLIATVTFDHH